MRGHAQRGLSAWHGESRLQGLFVSSIFMNLYAPYLEDITAIAFISSKYESLTRKIHFIPSKISSGSFQCNKLDNDWSNMYI
jgi:hypothetical protein